MNVNRITLNSLMLVLGLSLMSGVVYADRDDWKHGSRERFDRQRHDYRNDRGERYDRYVQKTRRDSDRREIRKVPKGYVYDKRFHHDRYYPRDGYVIRKLPSNPYRVHYHSHEYYFHAGVWYRPYNSTYIVVRPPIGLFVPVLPAFYTTIWFGGIPYYYANDVYYVWDAGRGGYIVSDPPPNATAQEQPPVASEQLFIYPSRGQSEKQQADDRFACHKWGVKQSGFDPTQPPENMSQMDINNERMDYQRAMKACLEGRGYTVR